MSLTYSQSSDINFRTEAVSFACSPMRWLHQGLSDYFAFGLKTL